MATTPPGTPVRPASLLKLASGPLAMSGVILVAACGVAYWAQARHSDAQQVQQVAQTRLQRASAELAEAEEARVRLEANLREFETFDAWARRSLDADLALRDERALEETVFAPIRREPHIVAAWVERAGADPRRVGLRTEAPLTFDWVELRGVPMLALLEAADAELPDARSPQGPPVRVLVLSREADSARGGGDVRVTVAFEAPAE